MSTVVVSSTPRKSPARSAHTYFSVGEAAIYLQINRTRMSRIYTKLQDAGIVRSRHDLLDSRKAMIPQSVLDQIKRGELDLETLAAKKAS
jgi:DNA-binding transcriptional regulator YhcF (GntR family)